MSGLNSFFKDDGLSKGILISILLLIFSSGFGILLGRFIFSYPILWMSRLFKGEATIDNVRMSAAYSFIPYFIAIPWILYLGIEKANFVGNINVFWITIFINNILWLYAMILLVIGLKHYNNYGYLKAILTISPFIIIAIITRIIIY